MSWSPTGSRRPAPPGSWARDGGRADGMATMIPGESGVVAVAGRAALAGGVAAENLRDAPAPGANVGEMSV
jgi:hypothetical protein